MVTPYVIWAWIAIAALWIFLASAIGVLVGRAITMADRRERERHDADPLPAPRLSAPV
jgi:hypothetical protein